MKRLERKIAHAIVSDIAIDKEEQFLRFQLCWEDDKESFYFYLDWDEEVIPYHWFFSHYFREGERRCPLCGEYRRHDCNPLSETEFEKLKEKLIEKNLKLMYLFQ